MCLFFKFQVYMIIYSIYLSLYKIFHLAGHPPSLPILLQMTKCLSLLWLNSVPLCIYYHVLLIYLSIDGHLGCFIILAIIKIVAMNIGLKLFFQTNVFVLFSICPGVELLGHMLGHMLHLFLVL